MPFITTLWYGIWIRVNKRWKNPVITVHVRLELGFFEWDVWTKPLRLLQTQMQRGKLVYADCGYVCGPREYRVFLTYSHRDLHLNIHIFKEKCINLQCYEVQSFCLSYFKHVVLMFAAHSQKVYAFRHFTCLCCVSRKTNINFCLLKSSYPWHKLNETTRQNWWCKMQQWDVHNVYCLNANIIVERWLLSTK